VKEGKPLRLTVTVCVGSSCHIKGAREVINQFNQLLNDNDLQDKVELKGSFCMERCGKGINWHIDEEPITSSNSEEAIELFKEKIIRPLKSD